MHRLDDKVLVTRSLLQRFVDEAGIEGGSGQHYALIQLNDGSFTAHNPASPEPDPAQVMFGRDVLTTLNRDLHHDGAWVFFLSHPEHMAHVLESTVMYARFGFIWLDSDGDAQFTFEWEKGAGEELYFHECLFSGINSWIERAETAWKTWAWTREALDAKPEQMVKRAQGQTRAEYQDPTNTVH